jgi:hypothetical protein
MCLPGMSEEKLKRQEAENIILKRFEEIKGREATDSERAELSKRKPLPGKHGLPNLGPVGTGFGLGGLTSREPKKHG